MVGRGGVVEVGSGDWWGRCKMMVSEHGGGFFFVGFGYARSRWCRLEGKYRFCSLMVDEVVCDMLYVSYPLKERD